MRKKTLGDIPGERLRGRTVVVRVDFNVPLSDDGRVADDTRLRRSLPTLRYLVDGGARSVLLSHLGRPGGTEDPALSLAPVAERLSDLLEQPVRFEGSSGPGAVRSAAASLDDGGVALVENTRFQPGEKANDPELARAWAEPADLFVNDAFGAAHRAHASTAGIARAVRERGGQAVAGLLVEEEMHFLDAALSEPDRPFVAILGGAKISGKIDVIRVLLSRVDRLLVGGAMANTFFAALGLEVGDSLVEEDRVATARELMESAGDRLLLPVDCVVAEEIRAGVSTRTTARADVGAGETIGDIGPDTRELFRKELEGARSVVWNGPMGVFEIEGFGAGTRAVAEAVAEVADRGGLAVVGGGDSASAAEEAGVADRLSHVSTGGGAALELLAGSELPALEALSDAG